MTGSVARTGRTGLTGRRYRSDWLGFGQSGHLSGYSGTFSGYSGVSRSRYSGYQSGYPGSLVSSLSGGKCKIRFISFISPC